MQLQPEPHDCARTWFNAPQRRSRIPMTTLSFHGHFPSSSMTPIAGDPARDVLLHDASARRAHLADLWVDTPRALVLVFLRQYGCPLCREQVASLRDRATAFAAEGVSIAAVGQGTPRDACRFREQLDLPFAVLSDADRSAYATYGLMDGTVEQIYSPVPGLKLASAMLRGHRPHRTIGSVRQLPGTFVIDRNGLVRVAHPGLHAADVPEIATLLPRILAAVPNPTS